MNREKSDTPRFSCPRPCKPVDARLLRSGEQMYPGRGAVSGLAVARAHRRAAYKQLPVTETRKKSAAVTLLGPHIGKMRGSVSQARLVVPRYGAVSRMPKWLVVPRYVDQCGRMSADGVQGLLWRFRHYLPNVNVKRQRRRPALR